MAISPTRRASYQVKDCDEISAPVTIIVGQAVRPGAEDEYVKWQQKVTTEASRYPGYLSSDFAPPTADQSDFTVVYRFDSLANAQHWLDSSTRQDLLDRAAPLIVGPGTRQILSEGSDASGALLTVVFTHPVPKGREDDFLAWCSKITEQERKFPGYRGIEIFRPIEGVQTEWNICLKFDSAEHLDAWLTSPERRAAVKSSPFGDFKMRRIDHSFGNWFSLTDQAVAPPSNFKTSIAVWMGLYPTVTILSFLTRPLGLPLWALFLVGNLLSSFIMSYLTMPFYSNPILKGWLRPKSDAPQPRNDIRGFALVLAINAAWAVFFYLITVVWHLV